MNNLITKTINLKEGDPKDKRNEILDYFNKTWEIDERLYDLIKQDETFYLRADPLRHPLIFYLGHTATFFINKLIQAKLIDKRIEPSYESMFAVGVDEMSWDDIDENHYNWPLVSQVREYRNIAKKVIINVIEETPLQMPITWESPFWAIMMGIEHERIHLETSSVLIRQLPLDKLQPGKFGKNCPHVDGITRNEFLPVPGAVVEMGKPFNHPLYGWDLEYGVYEEKVASFKASKELISNNEFLKFVEAGGYQTQRFWTEEGWNWKCFKQAEMPLFWRKNGDKYFLRLVADELSMPWIWPVEVNYLEAKAYCNWQSELTGKSLRMMTESEWYRLVAFCNVPDSQTWGLAPGNINLEHYASPCPVNMFKIGEFHDVVGNVWQWTETPITGYPGFKVHPLYDDFSTPTFDGQHNHIKGGSWISTGNESTYHARYAFRRHFYQHAGFRVVESL
jgi:5-histidylcysteine sulfoxide synthase